ncbi:NAD(P)-binding protein [Bimuria novae-zelandiae CBS 107.79]|uniref:NAD(P)-binding protein n=1 Tax=Bimuria novae-zelandiae CBS 107.79 TaxID=1447943 RepID=A0A6A5VNP5_9PLEO|nr:NAD(P)-binding protein [Bimuria novae-zelandiae CBS 107.79]
MPTPIQILLIGAGELGAAFLPHLSALPNTHVSVGVRTPAKYQDLAPSNVSLIAMDITSPSTQLSQTFVEYDIVISATGFGQSPGSVTKLAKEVFTAGHLRSLMPFFGEQAEVRNLLRAEAEKSNVKWTIVSTGIFMSFLFEQFWGIVDHKSNPVPVLCSSPDRVVVRALRDWEQKVSVTDVADIGKVLTRVVAGDVEADNRIVYAAGDTVSYRELSEIVECVAGKEVKRVEWTIPHLEAELAKNPDDLINKYRLVFARDGVWWDKKGTVNHQLSIHTMNVEMYARELFAAQK